MLFYINEFDSFENVFDRKTTVFLVWSARSSPIIISFIGKELVHTINIENEQHLKMNIREVLKVSIQMKLNKYHKIWNCNAHFDTEPPVWEILFSISAKDIITFSLILLIETKNLTFLTKNSMSLFETKPIWSSL